MSQLCSRGDHQRWNGLSPGPTVGESTSQPTRQNDFADSAWRPTGSALKSYGPQAGVTVGTRQPHGKSWRADIKAAETSQSRSNLITCRPLGWIHNCLFNKCVRLFSISRVSICLLGSVHHPQDKGSREGRVSKSGSWTASLFAVCSES